LSYCRRGGNRNRAPSRASLCILHSSQSTSSVLFGSGNASRLPPNHPLPNFCVYVQLSTFTCSHVVRFRSSPHTAHRPLQSGLHNGLMGTSSKRYSRTSGPRSTLASSGKIRPESETERSLNAYNSSNSVFKGCKKSARQRTHCSIFFALKSPSKSNPCGVRLMRTAPAKSLNLTSGENCRLGKSKWISRFVPIGWLRRKPTLIRSG